MIINKNMVPTPTYQQDFVSEKGKSVKLKQSVNQVSSASSRGFRCHPKKIKLTGGGGGACQYNLVNKIPLYPPTHLCKMNGP